MGKLAPVISGRRLNTVIVMALNFVGRCQKGEGFLERCRGVPLLEYVTGAIVETLNYCSMQLSHLILVF